MNSGNEFFSGVPWKELGATVGASVIAVVAALSGWLRAPKAAKVEPPPQPKMSEFETREVCEHVRAVSTEMRRIADTLVNLANLMTLSVVTNQRGGRRERRDSGDDDEEDDNRR